MRLLLSSFVALAVVAVPAVAHATAMDAFSLTGSGLSVSFELPASPVVSGYAPGFFFDLGDISFTENGKLVTDASVYFYTGDNGGGLTLTDEFGDTIDDLDFTSKQLFKGTVANPTFTPGSFALTSTDCGTAKAACMDKLTISSVGTKVTPEPGSLALLGTGTLGLVGMLRRRLSR